MSDPLSITGSAVGVISLGLVVCGQIVEYGRTYKGYRDDIQRMISKADTVCTPLKVLREIIEMKQINQPDTAVDISKKVMSIDAYIGRLRATIKRYGPTGTSDGLSNKARNQAKRAVYYFRKETLREISLDLDNMQSILHTTMSMYVYTYHTMSNSTLLTVIKQLSLERYDICS